MSPEPAMKKPKVYKWAVHWYLESDDDVNECLAVGFEDRKAAEKFADEVNGVVVLDPDQGRRT